MEGITGIRGGLCKNMSALSSSLRVDDEVPSFPDWCSWLLRKAILRPVVTSSQEHVYGCDAELDDFYHAKKVPCQRPK